MSQRDDFPLPVRTLNEGSVSGDYTDLVIMHASDDLFIPIKWVYITGQEGDAKQYQSASRIRRRIQEELPRDVEILKHHHPELLEELRDVVCHQ